MNYHCLRNQEADNGCIILRASDVSSSGHRMYHPPANGCASFLTEQCIVLACLHVIDDLPDAGNQFGKMFFYDDEYLFGIYIPIIRAK